MNFDKETLQKAEATYDLDWSDFDMNKSNRALDIMKGRKDTSKLVPVQKQITRNGKSFQQTVWVSPDDAKAETSQPEQGAQAPGKDRENVQKLELDVSSDKARAHEKTMNTFIEETHHLLSDKELGAVEFLAAASVVRADEPDMPADELYESVADELGRDSSNREDTVKTALEAISKVRDALQRDPATTDSRAHLSHKATSTLEAFAAKNEV